MRIAFLSVNQEKMPDPVVPLGILYLMANIDSYHQQELWDLCFEKNPADFLQTKIKSFNPEIIAIGVRNIQNNDYSGTKENISYYKTITGLLRTYTKAKLIIGGSGFNIMPKELMHALRPDYGITGEGERSLKLLINTLENKGKNKEKIPNLLYFKDSKLVVNPVSKDFIKIDELNPPTKEHLTPDYYKYHGIDSIQTKRGCIMKCTYCTYPKIEGKKYRLRSPKKVVAEMAYTLKKNPLIKHFFIVDSTFNLPIDHAKEVCQEMINYRLNTPWSCYINPSQFDSELTGLMAESKCAGIEIGTDSGDDEVLKNLKKGFTTKHVLKLHSLCKQVGIKECHTFLLGGPGEKYQQTVQTLNFLEDLNPHAAIIMIWKDDLESLNCGLEAKKIQDNKQILKLVKEKAKGKTNWVVPALNINFNYKLFQFIRKRKIRGPLWQQL